MPNSLSPAIVRNINTLLEFILNTAHLCHGKKRLESYFRSWHTRLRFCLQTFLDPQTPYKFGEISGIWVNLFEDLKEYLKVKYSQYTAFQKILDKSHIYLIDIETICILLRKPENHLIRDGFLEALEQMQPTFDALLKSFPKISSASPINPAWEAWVITLEAILPDEDAMWIKKDLVQIESYFNHVITRAQDYPHQKITQFIKKNSGILEHSILLIYQPRINSVEIFFKPNVQLSRLNKNATNLIAKGGSKYIKLGGYRIIVSIANRKVLSADKIVYFTRPVSLGLSYVHPLHKSAQVNEVLEKEFLYGGFHEINFNDGISERTFFYAVDVGLNLATFLHEKRDAMFQSYQHRQVIISLLQSILSILRKRFIPRDLKTNNTGIKIMRGEITATVYDCYSDLLTYIPFPSSPEWHKPLWDMLRKHIKDFNGDDILIARKQFAFEVIHLIGQYLRFHNNFQKETTCSKTPNMFEHILTKIIVTPTCTQLEFQNAFYQVYVALQMIPKVSAEPQLNPSLSQINEMLTRVRHAFEALFEFKLQS